MHRLHGLVTLWLLFVPTAFSGSRTGRRWSFVDGRHAGKSTCYGCCKVWSRCRLCSERFRLDGSRATTTSFAPRIVLDAKFFRLYVVEDSQNDLSRHPVQTWHHRSIGRSGLVKICSAIMLLLKAILPVLPLKQPVSQGLEIGLHRFALVTATIRGRSKRRTTDVELTITPRSRLQDCLDHNERPLARVPSCCPSTGR